jgi:GTP-binding protein
VKNFIRDYGWQGPCFAISAISGAGTRELIYAIMEHLENSKRLEAEAGQDELAAD